MIYLRLFWEFFKTGLFAVGGGMATFPFLSALGVKTGWFTQSQLADMIAVSESTPGPIGVNSATYVGFTVASIPGALIATLGLITPSIIIIVIIAALLNTFKDIRFVSSVFRCLRPASVGLITVAGLAVAKLVFVPTKDTDINLAGNIILAVVLLIFSHFVPKTKKVHPLVWIACSAVVGIVFHFGGV